MIFARQFEDVEKLKKKQIGWSFRREKIQPCCMWFKSNYEPHMIRHYSLKHEGKQMIDEKYSCEYCEYKAKENRSLKLHIKTKHEGLTYHCEMCDYKAAYSSQVKSHKLDKHDGVEYLQKMWLKDKHKNEINQTWRNYSFKNSNKMPRMNASQNSQYSKTSRHKKLWKAICNPNIIPQMWPMWFPVFWQTQPE